MSKVFSEKIAITVYGTDSRGDMFVEDTSTSFVAFDWIKLVLRKRMEPGSEIIVFNKNNGNQAEFLMEGQDPQGLFQARLKDPAVDIWEMDFGVAHEHNADTRPKVHLICKSCGSQVSIPLDAEEHSRVMTGEVLWRACAQCLEETDWQGEAYLAEQRRREEIKRDEEKRKAGIAVPAPAQAHLAATANVDAAATVKVNGSETNWAEKRSSRRIQMKTRARVRRVDGRIEIVAPIDVSKGGLGFESLQDYGLDDRVRVAMHYREGEVALETTGSIVRVTPREERKGYGIKFGF